MKIEQLRIGNWVWDDYSGEMIVKEIEKGNNEHDFVGLCKGWSNVIGKYNVAMIQPIFITEEWLKKLGFTDVRKYNPNAGYEIKIPGGCLRSYWNGRILICSHDDTIGFYCEYVHQLQNLYFALTQEELKIK